MDVRAKLVELLGKAKHEFWCSREKYNGTEFVAGYLIANGVTVQEWISVKDRLPEQGQEVIVYSGGVLKPTVFAYQFWNKNYDSWARTTYWMPLPNRRKENDYGLGNCTQIC